MHQRARQSGRQTIDVLLEPLSLVNESQARPLAVQGLGDAPGNAALVGDADDEPLLPLEKHSHPPYARRPPHAARRTRSRSESSPGLRRLRPTPPAAGTPPRPELPHPAPPDP